MNTTNTTRGASSSNANVTSSQLTSTMLGLESFGHTLFTGNTPLTPPKKNVAQSKPQVSVCNSKGRALVRTMIAMEEFGFCVFTA